MIDTSKGDLSANLYQGNLLNAAVRREIADLNRLFLERALHPTQGHDAWFRLPAGAALRLAEAPAEVRERAAQCPIALFELRLPGNVVETVADDPAESVAAEAATAAEARRAFGVTALGVVRRLTEGVPLAPRIAFGLDAAVEARLSAMTLSESFRMAAWPGLIRPRWPGHEPYWSLLAEAVIRGDGVQWAYAAGLCLLAQCERQPAVVAGGPRRLVRTVHRRPPRASRAIPC